MVAQPVNFGINLAGINYFNGNLPFRDLGKMAQLVVLPWDFPIGAPHAIGPEVEDTISGLDFGATADNFTFGGAYTSEHDYSADTFRVDHKKFGTVIAGDAATRTIPAVYNVSREAGRFSGFSGTFAAITFGTDYVQFGNDDNEFWTYANTNVTGAPIRRTYTVASGTFEVWNGRKSEGGAKIREITSATNGVEYTDAIVATPDQAPKIALYRKAGITSRLTEIKAYVSGNDCTGFSFSLPSITPEAVACTFTFTSNGTWIARGANISLSQDKAAGTGTVSLAANVEDQPRSLAYTGLRSGEKKWPANGIAMTVMLPSGSKYGTAGNWNAQYVSDLTKLHVRNLRTLDVSGANGVRVNRRFDNIYHSYGTRFNGYLNPRLYAELLALTGSTLAKPTLPDVWTAAEKKRFLIELDTYLASGVPIAAEDSNEVWNNGFSQFGNMGYFGSLKGVGYDLEQADRTHETITAWEEIGSSRPFYPTFGAQTGNLTNIGGRYDEVIDRKVNGGPTGPTLGQRLVAYGGRFTLGPYYSGGQADVDVTYDTVVAARGPSATQAQYYAELQTQHVAAQIASRQQHVATWTALQAKNVAKGFGATAIGLDIYEVNRHTGIYNTGSGSVGANTNFRNAYLQHEASDDMAQLQVLHLTELAAQVGGAITFYAGPVGRYNPIYPAYAAGQGFWGILWYTGEGTTGPGAVVNTTPSFSRIAALGAILDSGELPEEPEEPEPTPSTYPRFLAYLVP